MMGIFSIFEEQLSVADAARLGNLKQILAAIKRNDPELDKPNRTTGYSPLFSALITKEGKGKECAIALLEAGCSPNQLQGKKNLEPILATYSSLNPNFSTIRLLVSYGAIYTGFFIFPQEFDVKKHIKEYEQKVVTRDKSLKEAKILEESADYLSAMQKYHEVGNYWLELYETEPKCNQIYKLHYLRKALSYYQILGELSIHLSQRSTVLNTYTTLFEKCADICGIENLIDLRRIFASYAANTIVAQPLQLTLNQISNTTSTQSKFTHASLATNLKQRLKKVINGNNEEEEKLLKLNHQASTDHKLKIQ